MFQKSIHMCIDKRAVVAVKCEFLGADKCTLAASVMTRARVLAGRIAVLYDIILIYCPADARRARRLEKRLREAGFSVWSIGEDVLPGDDLFDVVEAASEKARILMLVMTPNLFGPEWPMYAAWTSMFRNPLNKDRRFIPVVLEKCTTPSVMQRYVPLSLIDDDDDAYDHIVAQCWVALRAVSCRQPEPQLTAEERSFMTEVEEAWLPREIPGVARLRDDSSIEFCIADPKAKSRNDAAVRLAVLALHACARLKQMDRVSNSEVVVPLQRLFGVDDGNTRRARAAYRGITRDGRYLSLNPSGQAEAERIVKQIQDPDYIGNWSPEAMTPNKSE